MRISTRTAGFAAIGLFVFACSSGTSNSTTTSSTSTGSTGTGDDAARSIIDTFCNTVAPIFCKADYTCCASIQGRVGDNLEIDDATGLKNCEQVIRGGGERLRFCAPPYKGEISATEAALQNGTIAFDQAQFDTCLMVLKSMTAGGAACSEPPLHILNTTCRSAFRGQIALGDACPYPGNSWEGQWEDSVLPCKDGRCENGKCVPFLKTEDACDMNIDQLQLFSEAATMLCNFPKKEVCWGALSAGGGGGDAGSAGGMGTCRPQAELSDACNPGNRHECKSYNCDVTGKCALPHPKGSACTEEY